MNSWPELWEISRPCTGLLQIFEEMAVLRGCHLTVPQNKEVAEALGKPGREAGGAGLPLWSRAAQHPVLGVPGPIAPSWPQMRRHSFLPGTLAGNMGHGIGLAPAHLSKCLQALRVNSRQQEDPHLLGA